MKVMMELTRPARKSGGDRYEGKIEGTDEILTIYFPQSISRKKGEPFMKIEVEIKGA